MIGYQDGTSANQLWMRTGFYGWVLGHISPTRLIVALREHIVW
jgi:hypothetical protein